MSQAPKRLLRKAETRRMQVRIKQGRRRIARREREAQKLKKQLDLTDAVETMPPRSSRTVIMNIEHKGRGGPLPFDMSAL
jgi:hypothetical protein